MRIYFRFLILLFLIFFSLRTYCQSLYITGKVINVESNKAIENANVYILVDDHIIFTSYTDSLGLFKVPRQYLTKDFKVKISFLKSEDIYSIKWPKENVSSLDVFKFKVPVKSLKEVRINVRRRYHDTTKIDLSAQKFERSVMIDDLFSKNLGFSKDGNGQLYYKGKIVSNLLVNGRTFFGGNNLDIYKLLPALIINSIEVVETNVDSITNTTNLRPTIKINLQLKDKYSHGKFGDLSIGGGTSDRYLGNLDMYTYKKAEQVSITLNSSNINKNNLQDPDLAFTGNGNDLTSSIAQVNYRNTWKKIDLSVSIKGKKDDQNTFLESQRNDEIIKQFSKVFTSSTLKAYKIENSYFNLRYNIDSLNTLILGQSVDYGNSRRSDSSNYLIITDTNSNRSELKRVANSFNNAYSTNLRYERRFSSLKGRLLSFEINNDKNTYSVNESDIENSINNKYNINSKRAAKQNILKLNADFTEPLGDEAYARIFASYKNEKDNYDSSLNSDMILNSSNISNGIINHHYQLGVSFHKTFKRLSYDQNISEIFDKRDISIEQHNNQLTFNYLNFDSRFDYKISANKGVLFNIKRDINYPSIYELTSINNNVVDPLYQQVGNINLKPEIDNKISIDYNVKRSELLNFSYFVRMDYYQSKIGINIFTAPQNRQITFSDNVGNSTSNLIGFSVVKQTLSENYFRAATTFNYSNAPAIVNNKTIMNSSIVLNQSFSGKITCLDQTLSSIPTLAISYGKYDYESNGVNQLNLICTDKESLTIKKFTFNAYGIFNFNHSVSSTHTFGINAEVVKSILKKYGKVWIKVYDIFNTYKLLSNEVGPSYIQSSNYLNLQRYILVGFSLNFNNMR